MSFRETYKPDLFFEENHKPIGTIARDTERDSWFTSKGFSKGARVIPGVKAILTP